jgi:ABC-type Na+ efflux pump permease subunit
MQEQMKLYRNEFRYERHRRAQLIKTGRDVEALPEHHPLAWREQRRMRLYRWSERLVHAWIGTRIIIGLLLAGFVWLSYLITVDNHLNLRSSATEWECFPWLALTLLLIGSVATVITASGLFAGERSRRSMDLLLVLPMSTTALIAEKLSGCILVTRLMTAFIAISIISACTAEIRLGQPLIALVAGPLAVLTAWVCLQLLTWIAVAVSLRVQDQVRAAIIACAVILCWCILPPVGIALLNGNAAVPAPLLWCASLLCPVPTVLDTTTAEPLWQLRLVANLAVCSTLLWVVRRNCLRQADRLLGRQP